MIAACVGERQCSNILECANDPSRTEESGGVDYAVRKKGSEAIMKIAYVTDHGCIVC